MIELRTSPHVKGTLSLPQIMRHVVYALLPICAFAVYQFGLSALALLIVVTLSCVLTELLFNRLASKNTTIHDNSAYITGILLALTLPPGFPLWMGAVAGFVAIALGKSLFGGIGFNPFNPALMGRAFVQAAFPVAITSWTPAAMNDRFSQFIPSSLSFPFALPSVNDAISEATPLALHKFEATTTSFNHLFFGFSSGSLGETSSLLIMLCGAYLILRGMMGWRIPAAILLSSAVLSGLFYLVDNSQYPSPIFMLTSGGLMLGALFMATDPVSAPVTLKGMWVFGFLIGILTIIIRLFGGLPEGIMYAILLANASVPLIEAVTQPRKFGWLSNRDEK
ncbi:MAG: RnfABCDGE type electron transport complex subunit D [gamma proteobacterium symbiont of Taylorina sp.]|nr:RnfABCDGE type electron transport complex subunit D [gamma proteobacterium symbiont of Taylorina sp.]